MQVKIDTSEKFHVITVQEKVLSANMTEDLKNRLYSVLKQPIKNLILNLEQVETAEPDIFQTLADVQQRFAEKSASFVTCTLQAGLKDQLSAIDPDESFVTAPTLSEASDIVLMDEIERELEEE